MSSTLPPPDPSDPAMLRAGEQAGEPIAFQSPWQVTVFALTLHLVELGRFSWSEWSEAFGEELKAGRSGSGEADYFNRWAAALQRLLVRKQHVQEDELTRLADAIHAGNMHEEGHHHH